MSIRHAILGFVSWQPLSGYDLKKLFGETEFIIWAGTGNQIYNNLIDLHREGLVSSETQQPERGPARKLYRITERGHAELDAWLASAPEPPQLRNTFLIQLAWADRMTPAALDDLLARYEQHVEVQLKMAEENGLRKEVDPARTARERYLWERVVENRVGFWRNELAWARETRAGVR